MTANERILVHSLRSDAGFFYTFAFPTEGKVHPRCWKHRCFSRDKLVTRTRWLLVPFASRGQRPIDVEGNCCWKSEHDEEAWRPCDPHPHSRGAREGSNAHEQTRTRYSHREPRHLPEEVWPPRGPTWTVGAFLNPWIHVHHERPVKATKNKICRRLTTSRVWHRYS